MPERDRLLSRIRPRLGACATLPPPVSPNRGGPEFAVPARGRARDTPDTGLARQRLAKFPGFLPDDQKVSQFEIIVSCLDHDDGLTPIKSPGGDLQGPGES